MSSASPPQPDAPTEVEVRLRARLRQLDRVLVALSGGVDSSVMAALAAGELGDRAVAATGVSASLSSQELDEVRAFCTRVGIEHITVQTDELSVPGYVENSPDRCYFCKSELFESLAGAAAERGLTAIVDGTTAEDLGGHRPGKRAADERGVVSPLVEVGAGKADVRAIASRLGLPNAERPASPCLSSRIAYGVEVTSERLLRVGEAEAYLRALGFSDLRVRLHDHIARLEVPAAELAIAVDNAAGITARLRELGFTYVTLDLAGLRSGSLLEVLNNSGR